MVISSEADYGIYHWNKTSSFYLFFYSSKNVCNYVFYVIILNSFVCFFMFLKVYLN